MTNQDCLWSSPQWSNYPTALYGVTRFATILSPKCIGNHGIKNKPPRGDAGYQTNCSTGLASCSVKVARSLRECGKPCDAKVEGTESKLKSNTNQIKGRKVLRRLNSDTVMQLGNESCNEWCESGRAIALFTKGNAASCVSIRCNLVLIIGQYYYCSTTKCYRIAVSIESTIYGIASTPTSQQLS